MKNLKLMETIKNKIKLMEVIIDSDIFRNFIDDKVGIVDKSKTEKERERGKKKALKSSGIKESRIFIKFWHENKNAKGND